MRALPSEFTAYAWAPSTRELAHRLELDPSQIVRFDGNVPAWPLPASRPGALAAALADVQNYPHGGYTELTAAVARYAGVGPENVVLGAGAAELTLLCARAFAGTGDGVAIAERPAPSSPMLLTSPRSPEKTIWALAARTASGDRPIYFSSNSVSAVKSPLRPLNAWIACRAPSRSRLK